ncbi:hypothetical protein [Polyangium aurulentum]|uniref:hypothetical protein n=1 Tax=Polyangium aurulentum TaxID=2567896 RepID=UPI0010AE56B3|nr:hypothetical protein [Polyangium aurulentum]UQA55479.1 hypothetical protein E8A73_029545 [Polyangium aurulentum]
MVHRRLHSCSLAVIALLGGSSAFAADPAAAEALFQKGVAEMDAGHFDAACPALAESQRLDPRPGTLCALAECEAKAGRIATASSLYTDYLRQYEAMSAAQKNKHAERAKGARAQKEALAAEVPELSLVLLPGAPRGTRVVRDGVELSAASLDIPLPVDPGEHVIATQVPGGPLHEERIRVSRGETTTVELWAGPAPIARKPAPAVQKRVVSSPAPAPVKENRAWMRTAAYISGGVGLAGLAVGASMGAVVWSMKPAIDEGCPNRQCETSAASETAVRAQGFAHASEVGFAVAGAGAVGAGVFLLLANKKSDRIGPAKPGVHAGSIEVGPGGAAAFVKGVF